MLVPTHPAAGHATGEARVLPGIVAQHLDEVTSLWMVRDGALRQSMMTLDEILRLDDRIEAHIDGLRVAADDGWHLDPEPLQTGWAAEFFGAGVVALERGEPEGLQRVISAAYASAAEAAALPPLRARDPWRGLVSALGWVGSAFAKPVVEQLIDTPRPRTRWLGVAAIGARRLVGHRGLETLLADDAALVRARAARVAGVLGRLDLLGQLWPLLADEDPACRYWSAWAAARLGAAAGLEVLAGIAATQEGYADAALTMLLRRLPHDQANALLKPIGKDPARQRTVLRGAAIVGDGLYLPWLVAQAADPAMSRLAGLAVTTITGVDLVAEGLCGAPPAGGAEDDGTEEEAGLPAPDPDRLARWWKGRAAQFQAGTPYFLGTPKQAFAWVECLRSAPQCWRRVAALELAIRHPARAMFPVGAPADFQRRALARAGG